MTRGRAILIASVTPDPHGWGLPRRAWSWVSELAEAHDLETIIVSPHPSPPPAAAIPGRVRYLHSVGPPVIARRLRDFSRPNAAVAGVLSNMAGPVPDRVVVLRLYLHDVAGLMPPPWREKAEIDCDDWESATRLSLARVSLRLGRWRDARTRLQEALRYAVLERQVLRSYKLVHISAKEDVPVMRRLFRLGNIRARPNRIAAIAGAPAATRRPARPTLLFVGTLGYEPNEDAVRWIGQAIAPRLRRSVPDADVLIAGEASKDLQTFMSAHGLTYVPAPPDLWPIYAKATVAVAPLRGGGGTKIKVLEAWQHKRPVVGTSHAARGLSAVPGQHLMVANTAAAFAAACVELVSNADLARRIADAGHHLFCEAYEL